MELTCKMLQQYDCCGLQQDTNPDGNYPCDVCHSTEALKHSTEFAEFDFFEKVEYVD